MLYLKRVLSVSLLNLLLFSSCGYADENYQTEIFGGYKKEDADSSTNKDTWLLAEIYFSPVNTDNKPLAQAAFLDKSSSVSIGYINLKTEYQNSSFNSRDLNGPYFEINYITETNSFILGARYLTNDIETDPSLVTGDFTVTRISIGKYLNDSSAVSFSYKSSDTEYQSTVSSQSSNFDVKRYGLSYKTVQSLDVTSYYRVIAEIDLINKSDSDSVEEDNVELGISGAYYFTRMTSLGAGIMFNSGDDVSDEGRTPRVGFTHFFSPQVAFNITLSRFNADDSQTEDTDSISVGVIARI